MAITFYGGPPGAGKSYALVEQVIVPGVLAGRRVLTNVAGVDPEKVFDYCCAKVLDPDELGEVVLFDGEQAIAPGFFPTDAISDADTFVKGGDLLVFDEWRLYFPRRGKLPTPDVEAFLRWHRHLVSEHGAACDVAIASQIATDVHQDFRGLIERSYKFKKLKAVGLPKAYAWDVYEGHLQPKGGAYDRGNGAYKAEITALYRSYSTQGNATELNSDKRLNIFKGWLLYAGCFGLVVLAASVYFIYWFFVSGAGMTDEAPALPPVGLRPPGFAVATPVRGAAASDRFRIVGHLFGDLGVRVIVADRDGNTRVLPGDGFEFDGERPVSGTVDGERVIAEDRVVIDAAPAALGIGVIP